VWEGLAEREVEVIFGWAVGHLRLSPGTSELKDKAVSLQVKDARAKLRKKNTLFTVDQKTV
jgi:hypothetical protein